MRPQVIKVEENTPRATLKGFLSGRVVILGQVSGFRTCSPCGLARKADRGAAAISSSFFLVVLIASAQEPPQSCHDFASSASSRGCIDLYGGIGFFSLPSADPIVFFGGYGDGRGRGFQQWFL
jgi:hypothetical protein